MRPAAAALLALAACAETGSYRPPTLPAEGATRVYLVSDLRSRNGACAQAPILKGKFELGSIQACARMGSPGTLYDNPDEPLLITGFDSSRDRFAADPGNWRLEITSNSGAPVFTTFLKRQVPSVGTCSSFGCSHYAADVARPPTWKAGDYRLRYTYAHDTSISVVLTLILSSDIPRTEGVGP
jgi:hypothetical protein